MLDVSSSNVLILFFVTCRNAVRIEFSVAMAILFNIISVCIGVGKPLMSVNAYRPFHLRSFVAVQGASVKKYLDETVNYFIMKFLKIIHKG